MADWWWLILMQTCFGVELSVVAFFFFFFSPLIAFQSGEEKNSSYSRRGLPQKVETLPNNLMIFLIAFLNKLWKFKKKKEIIWTNILFFYCLLLLHAISIPVAPRVPDEVHTPVVLGTTNKDVVPSPKSLQFKKTKHKQKGGSGRTKKANK